ncbi:MAG TPA: cytochrome c oxidase subunit 3 [Candidatus Elarobacter sp.]|jgi:cytochrome c oxidase subunit 3
MSARIGNAGGAERLTVRGHALILGVILFLASELMFFAAWFAAYFGLRGRNAQWPPAGVELDTVESSIGTALLGLSSLLVLIAIRDVHAGRNTRARLWLTGTVVCGVLFLAETVHGWSKNTFTFASHAYGSVFYGMTGFHAAHVTAGVIMLAFLAAGADKPGFRQEHAAGAEAISYYWHFVFVVWLGLWATIYFVR